jgi:hypothetical protein
MKLIFAIFFLTTCHLIAGQTIYLEPNTKSILLNNYATLYTPMHKRSTISEVLKLPEQLFRAPKNLNLGIT